MLEWTASPFFGIALTIFAFWVGTWIQKKTGLVICNSLILADILIIALLLALDIPYENYAAGGNFINMMLAPATACIAVSIYEKRHLLKKDFLPIMAGCIVGMLTASGSVYVMCRLFDLDRAVTAALLPKSVTTPIASAIAESNNGIVPIAVAAVAITGILGNLLAPYLIRLFRVKDPLEAGLGIGACSHALGTAKAVELGKTEGAMSGLAIGLCGVITALLALFFPLLLGA